MRIAISSALALALCAACSNVVEPISSTAADNDGDNTRGGGGGNDDVVAGEGEGDSGVAGEGEGANGGVGGDVGGVGEGEGAIVGEGEGEGEGDEEPTDPIVPDPSCINFTALNNRNPDGGALRDIEQHLPDDEVDYYCDPDVVTCGHEVSHGIHAYLRNNLAPSGANAFYILDDRACFVAEPPIFKHEAAPFVPQALQGFRYDTYVTGQSAWDDTPLYLWDEWNAYVNGGEVGLSLYDEGLWNDGWRDQSGPIEFVAYGVAVGMAAEQNGGVSEDVRLMMAYLLRRSFDMQRRFHEIGDFQFDDPDATYETLRTGDAAADIRDFLRRTYGDAFVNEVFDLP